MTHAELVAAILLEFGQMREGRLWKQNTGVARIDGRIIRFGLKGQTDITGVVCGRRVEIEVKTGSGRPSKQQESFLAMIRNYGGISGIVGRVDDARYLSEEAKCDT